MVVGTGRAVTLFERMFDDAALFPPGNAPMAAAVADHGEQLRGPYGPLVGPFVCSAARLSELTAELEAQSTALELALVSGHTEFDPAIDAALAETRISLRAIEVRMEADDSAPVAPEGVDLFLEYPWDATPAIPAGAARKMRTGGLQASHFPTDEELAEGIHSCVTNDIPFKLTAGLHDAIRWSDMVTGFEHHGFLNVVLATHAATEGGDAAQLSTILSGRNSTEIADRIRQLRNDEVTAIRGMFRSFGTCSVADPINDLRALGLLD